MYASATTYVDVIPQIYLYFPSPSRAQRRSHHPTTTRVPLSGHAYGSETACHNRTARVSSTHTAAIDDPHTARGDLPHPPCVTPRTHARRVRSHGPRPGPRVPPSHYRLGVTRMQIWMWPGVVWCIRVSEGSFACPSPPSTVSGTVGDVRNRCPHRQIGSGWVGAQGKFTRATVVMRVVFDVAISCGYLSYYRLH